MSMPVPALGGITNLRQTLGAHDHRTTGAGVRCFPGAQPLAHSPWRTATRYRSYLLHARRLTDLLAVAERSAQALRRAVAILQSCCSFVQR